MKSDCPPIDVSCAIIERAGQVLVAQRSEVMTMPLKWEFPGGKMERDESAADCLRREIQEELGVTIHIIAALPPSGWTYRDFVITLHPFVCHLRGGTLRLAEHRGICWLAPEELSNLDWAEADVPVLEHYLRYLERA